MGKHHRKHDPHAEREAQKYENPIPSREFILDFLTQRGRPASYKQIISELKLESDAEQEALRRRLIAMIRDGQLMQNRRGAYGPLDKMELISGRVIGHKDGFGFVVPDEGGGDLFLNGRQMRGVLHNDKVLVSVANIDDRGRREGIVVEVLERATTQLVGRLFMESGTAFVEPSNQRVTQDILISPDALKGAKSGQMVVVEMVEQPTARTRPTGKVIEILGDHMAPGMEIDVAIRNHELPHIWPEEVLNAAAKFSKEVSEDAIVGRLDLRDLPFVTIDGEDAKDFDDAVYCQPKKNGWTLFVAIADVSHYVRPESLLDQEALNRGTSVYFPEHVIPMLPEALSNELCSLKPNVNRLTMVCEMAISSSGKITNYRFHEAVIRSHARLTYNQVYAMVVQKDKELQTRFQTLLPHLEELFSLYHVLHKARQLRGSIDFDLPETKIIFGPERKIERIIAVQRNDAHRMIEECMLCANICASKFLIANNCPGLFRIHEGPSEEKLEDLRRFLSEIGIKISARRAPAPKDYAEILESIKDRPDAHLIQTVLLRSLSQAVYSPENKGHFGLAFDAYAHFTSPIRRYPDLFVHRAIRSVLREKYQPGEYDSQLEKLGEHCSMTERRADDATRDAMDWLKCEFMMDKVGENFSGVISSVTSFGLFVELTDIYVDGLVHISMLPNDYYRFDPIKHTLYGERAGRRFRLGDVIQVKVARVDLDEREIDLVLAETVETQRPRKKKGKKNLL